jgi:hypothetical protein
MTGDWKEIENANEPCSSSNGWCGWCGKCREHSEDLHRQADWEDE